MPPKKKPQFKSKNNEKEITTKQCKQIAHRATETVMLACITILADKHKWSAEKIEELSKDILFVVNSIKSNDINRTDLYEIIEKHTGVDVKG